MSGCLLAMRNYNSAVVGSNVKVQRAGALRLAVRIVNTDEVKMAPN